MKNLYLISYDISNDKGRRNIEKIIKHYGHRIQYSVFQCDISPSNINRLKIELNNQLKKHKELYKKNHDSLIIIPICLGCQKGIVSFLTNSFNGKRSVII